MLRPIETSTRELKPLDGLWRFIVDSPELEAPWRATLPGEQQCPVPASYNDIFVPSLRDHIGKVWYQRMVRVPRGWSDQRVFIRFDSATHAAEVYINDQLVISHVGGYTPFEADITGAAVPGREIRITVAVDNTLTNETIPPGQLVTNEFGKRQQKYWHDFFNFAGLARSVKLFSKPAAAIEDVTVTTEIDGAVGIVKYGVKHAGEQVEVDLVDEEGVVVATSSGDHGEVRVEGAKLWRPRNAYLYRLDVRLLDAHGSTLDEYHVNVGIRTIHVQGTQIYINNEPFYFTGFGKHEDTPVRGKGHDDAWMVHDFELMGWTGANSFRTSHYPYAEEVLDYADRHGWVVIDETPAVGLNLNIGGGIFGSGLKKTFGPDFANDNTQKAHADVIRELIQRDKNHPSVVMWCVTNEPGSGEEGSREYFEPLVKLTRELDPTRLVTYTNLTMVPASKERVADLFDVIGLNRYYGWYEYNGDLESAEKRLEEELKEWEGTFKRPLLMLEYGTDTVAGLHSVGDLPWSEEYQSAFYDMSHRVFDRVEAVRGEQVWNFADFSTGPGIFRVDGNKKGVFTRDRRPKQAAHVLRKRWSRGV